jgi:Fe-S-cluster containining protein
MLGAMELKRERLNQAATATYERTAVSLAASRSGATCAALCRRLNRIVDGAVDASKAAGAAVACAPRGALLCQLRVGVFEHQAAALLHHRRTQVPQRVAAEIEQRIRVNASRIDQLTVEQHRSAGVPCAFLHEGLCAAHEARPSACAAYHSLSRERCEHSFRHPQGIGTAQNPRPALVELQVLGAALIEATQAGCRSAGARGEQAELHQALRAALESES